VRIQPHAEPLFAGSSSTGVLLSHGFTGSPASMRPWGEDLLAAGYRVAVPRLPGHGTHWNDLNRTGWQDWYAAIERAYLRLRDECDLVVAGGQSMGGGLVLHLAARYGRGIDGVVLVNPSLGSTDRRMVALPLIHRFVSSIAAIGGDVHKPATVESAYDRTPLTALLSLTKLWKTVSDELPDVKQPLLVFRSPQDHVVDGSSLRLLRSRVGSRQIEEHALPDSYHVATLDYDAPTIFAETRRFIARLRQERTGAVSGAQTTGRPQAPGTQATGR
jgi:carboxylesterase